MSVILVQDTATRLPQNLLTYSDDLDNAIWAPTRLETVVYDATYDDWIHEPTTDTGAHYTAQTLLTTLGNSDYTLSVRLRYINHRWAVLRFYDGTDVYYQSVDLLNGALGKNLNTTSESITEVSTDVYDVSFTCPAVAASSISNVVIGLNNTDTLALESWTPAGTEQVGVSRASLENYSTAGVYTKTTSAAIAGGNRVLTRLPQNLLKHSSDTGNAVWTITNGVYDEEQTTDPDGGSNADMITCNAGTHAVQGYNQNALSGNLVVGAEYTWSMYVKAGTNDYFQMTFWAATHGANAFANFDLANGILGTVGSAVTAVSMTDEGDDWYRLSITAPCTAANTVLAQWAMIDNASAIRLASEVWAGTETVYIYGSQFEAYADGPGTYVATTTAAVPGVTITRASTATYFDHNGIMQTAAIGEERTDYDPSDNSLRGLLIEESRTNLCKESETLGTAPWSPGASAEWPLPADQTTAPDGTTTADQIIDDAAAAGDDLVFISQAVTVATSTEYCYSAFLKADQLSWAALRIVNFTTPATSEVFFDLTNGVVGTADAGFSDSGIQDVGNGWYRCWGVFTTDVADTTGVLRIMVCDGDNDFTVADDGTSSIFAWGVQLEAGAAPSSYIPTTTASVTRAADDISVTDLTQLGYNSAAGTMYVKFSYVDTFVTGTAAKIWMFYDSADAPNNRISLDKNAATQMRLLAYDVNVNIASTIVDDTEQHDNASAWEAGDYGNTTDGGAATTAAGSVETTVNTLAIGDYPTISTQYMNGHIAKLVYYPKRLADADLVTLSGTGTYLPTSVATADSIADALMIRLNDRGYTVGSLDDRMHQYFNAQGYAGSIQDQWRLHLDSLGYATRDLQADMMEWLEDKRPSYLGDLSDVDDLSSLWLEYLTTYEDWLQ